MSEEVLHNEPAPPTVPTGTGSAGRALRTGAHSARMTSPLRVREPQELLALIPYQLGFQPSESVVVVSLRAPRHRVGLVMRVDLDDLAEPVHGRQVARGMVSRVVADGGRDCVLVVYSDGPVPETGGGAPVWEAVGSFVEAAEVFLGSVDVWHVSSTGYAALGCTDPLCCPPGGRPLADLLSTEVGAHMVLAGATVVSSRDELARLPRAVDADRRRASAAANRWRRRRREASAPEDLRAWRRGALTVWREALDGVASAPGMGRLEAGLEDVLVRDAVLVSLVPGVGALPEELLGVLGQDDEGTAGATATHPCATSAPVRSGRWASTDSAVGDAIAAIVDPGVGIPPDPELARDAQRVLEGVVAHGRRGQQAPALTLLALLTWWQGSGARAEALLARARESDPSYRLAALLGQALDAGMPPGWVHHQAEGRA